MIVNIMQNIYFYAHYSLICATSGIMNILYTNLKIKIFNIKT